VARPGARAAARASGIARRCLIGAARPIDQRREAVELHPGEQRFADENTTAVVAERLHRG
jgi:hypothetical protein